MIAKRLNAGFGEIYHPQNIEIAPKNPLRTSSQLIMIE